VQTRRVVHHFSIPFRHGFLALMFSLLRALLLVSIKISRRSGGVPFSLPTR
jgi:hypothetical protein